MKAANQNRVDLDKITKDMSPCGAFLFKMIVENQRREWDEQDAKRDGFQHND